MVRRKRKDRPGPGYLLRLEWSPEVVVAYFVGWVVGYVGRLWSVTLARWFRASAGKRPKAGHFPTRTPPALYPGPHPPYPTRYDKGHPRRSPTAARQRHRRKARPPTYPPGEGPELERNPGAQLSHPPIPRRRLVSQAGTVPTHRSRTNPTSEQKQCPRPG